MENIEEHSIILYNEDQSLHLKIFYIGYSKEKIIADIRKRYTGQKSRWVQFKYCDKDS